MIRTPFRPARRFRTAAAALVVAVAGAGLALGTAGPARAAACGTSTGVSVVVDFTAQGGGVETICDPGGSKKSAAALVDAAFDLTYVQRQPGFVCRVSGVPASDPCVNTPPGNAYWGLFYSDGKSGSWVYSSLGLGGLRVADGGSIGLAWQDGGSTEQPGLAPPVLASAPSPTATPSKKPSKKPSPTPTGSPSKKPPSPVTSAPSQSAASKTPGGTDPSETAAGAESSSQKPSEKASERPTRGNSQKSTQKPRKPSGEARPSESSSQDAAAGASSTDDPTSAPTGSTGTGTEVGTDSGIPAAESEEGGRVPTWLSLLLLAGLPVAAAAIWWRRRGIEPS